MLELAVLWAAVRTGVFYGLLGLSYFLIVRTTRLLNFSVGAYAMLGGVTFGALTVRHDVSMPVAVLLALVVAVAAAVLTEALVVRPIESRTSEEFAAVMAIIALLFVLEQLAALAVGHGSVTAPRLIEGSVTVAGTRLGGHELLSTALALGVVAAVAWWVKLGKYGRLLRAVGDNEEAARTLGLLVTRARYLVMALAGAIAGLAGLLVAPQAGLNFETATSFAILGFIALVVGGTGSVWAPLCGGMLVSFLEVYGSLALGSTSRDYILLSTVLLVFLARPQGLFAVQVRT